MRTTITLDEDVTLGLKRAAQVSGKNFKTVVNDAIRAGLSRNATLGKLPPF